MQESVRKKNFLYRRGLSVIKSLSPSPIISRSMGVRTTLKASRKFLRLVGSLAHLLILSSGVGGTP